MNRLLAKASKILLVGTLVSLGVPGTSTMSVQAKDNSKSISPEMDRLWGNQSAQLGVKEKTSVKLFRDGNYAMFIHWGLYSNLAGKWNGKTHYGIGEWLMHPRMAGIPIGDYMNNAKTFNPVDFDADAIANLAKAAGMKYIVITSKHHEGFAMFDSSHPFNIVDGTPFGRDPMKELADACRKQGLGFGFYYSHYQDWTAPGAHGGPRENPDGSKASFSQYFKDKCYPQVKEICTNYGPLTIVWFDTPGSMPKEHVVALRDLVRKTQPGALLCSRIGHGMGDYVSHGDMEVPIENIDGLWETVDTTNDSWSFAWYDNNWKGPKSILRRLISTIARGGTYMLNVGPDGSGDIPDRCEQFLRQAGAWIETYPEVVYRAKPSPWGHELPWGDVTMVDDSTLNLCIYEWPRDGRLHLPGLTTDIQSATLLGAQDEMPLAAKSGSRWKYIELPQVAADPLVSVIRLRFEDTPVIDGTWGVHPNFSAALPAHFAKVIAAKKKDVRWMEKFGEWKHKSQVSEWENGGTATWTVDVCEPAFYRVGLSYRGEDRLVWRVEAHGGEVVQNEQAATSKYAYYPIGVIEFKAPGKHKISVSLVEGKRETASLASLHLQPVE